jgi:hypothetical protein
MKLAVRLTAYLFAQEGLAKMAKKMGVQAHGMPFVHVHHK